MTLGLSDSRKELIVMLLIRVKQTQRYKTKLQQAIQEGKEAPEVLVYGAEKPTYRDIFAVQLIFLPVTIFNGIRWLMKPKAPKTQEEMEKEIQEMYGMTLEEFEAAKARQTEKLLNSSKYKR